MGFVYEKGAQIRKLLAKRGLKPNFHKIFCLIRYNELSFIERLGYKPINKIQDKQRRTIVKSRSRLHQAKSTYAWYFVGRFRLICSCHWRLG